MQSLDLLTVIGGWIVAGLVTLVGVIIAHRLNERSRDREDDRIGLYEPLRREMQILLNNNSLAPFGYRVWSPSQTFNDIIMRGVLFQARHDSLKQDIETLRDLGLKHDSNCQTFAQARRFASDSAFQTYELANVGMEHSKLYNLMGVVGSDSQFMDPLASGNNSKWIETFQNYMVSIRKNFPNAISETPPQKIFEELWAQTGKEREQYQAGVDALMKQAEKIDRGVEIAIRRGSLYRSG